MSAFIQSYNIFNSLKMTFDEFERPISCNNDLYTVHIWGFFCVSSVAVCY